MATEPTISTTRSAIRHSIAAQAVGVLLEVVLAQGGVMALLILALGGGAFEVGLASAIFSVTMVVGVLAAPRVDVSDRRTFLLRGMTLAAIAALGYLLFMPVRRAAGELAAVWFLLLVYLVVNCLMNWGFASWFPMVAEMVPQRMRGRYLGNLRTSWRLTSTTAILLCGLYLGAEPALWKFYPVLGVGLGLWFVRLWLLRRLPAFPPPRVGKPEPLMQNLRRPFLDRSFVRFMWVGSAIAAAQMVAWAFIVPYLKETLGFPSSWTMYAVAAIGVGQVMTLMWWGRMTDRWGNRFVFLISILICAAGLGLLIVMPSYRASPAIAFALGAAANLLFGIGSGGWQIAQTVRMLHAAPKDQLGPYTAVFMMVVGVSTGLVTLAGGAVLDGLPRHVEIRGIAVEAPRVYFSIVLGLVLATATLIRQLEPVREPGLRRVVAGLSGILPAPLNLPLVPLRMYLRFQARDDDSEKR